MSYIDRVLSECPTMQEDLGTAFQTTVRQEALPYLEYLNSELNNLPIKQRISENGKLRTVEVVWNQRLPETEVTEGVSIASCTASNVYGDTAKQYTLNDSDSFGANQVVNVEDLIKHCKDNNTYVIEQIARLINVAERKIASAIATQAAAQKGKWGTEVSGFYTVDAQDNLELKTLNTGGTIYEFTLQEIQQAAQMANYPGPIVGFGGAAMNAYAQRIIAGCCANSGIDLSAILANYGFAFAYDFRVATAFGGQNFNMITTPGAQALLTYELASWDFTIGNVQVGSNYARNIVFGSTGHPFVVTLKDDCGSLSINVVSSTKLITLPSDLYAANDKYAGVNYTNSVEIKNS